MQLKGVVPMRRLICLLIMFQFICGCAYKHLDYVGQFNITGRVHENISKIPLDEVKIFFVDTGFDQRRSKQRASYEIGESTQGQIDLKFDYSWGVNIGLLTSMPPETFIIQLLKAGYKSKQFNIKVSDLDTKGHIIFVPLREVYLDPE